MIRFELSFVGGLADAHEIDFYDVSKALLGFQRSLAITTHLVLNGEIITQAPALKNAKILAVPPEEGSWKITAVVMTSIIGGAYALGTAPQDTPIGHLVYSAYDYILSESLGIHVDYDMTIGEQLEQQRRSRPDLKHITENQLDSAIEKCEVALKDMHRPIVMSETAGAAIVTGYSSGKRNPIGPAFTDETYAYLAQTERDSSLIDHVGWVSSYNMNTFRGRVYLSDASRPVPFELAEDARGPRYVGLLTNSLMLNARDRLVEGGAVTLTAYRNLSSTGRLKGLYVTEVNRV